MGSWFPEQLSPCPLQWGAWNLHWTTREVPYRYFFFLHQVLLGWCPHPILCLLYFLILHVKSLAATSLLSPQVAMLPPFQPYPSLSHRQTLFFLQILFNVDFADILFPEKFKKSKYHKVPGKNTSKISNKSSRTGLPEIKFMVTIQIPVCAQTGKYVCYELTGNVGTCSLVKWPLLFGC